MLQRIKELFSKPEPQSPEDLEHELSVACAVLLVEMQRADHETAAEEEEVVVRMLAKRFGLDDAEAEELLSMAKDRTDEAVSLHEFTSLLHDHFDAQQKRRLLEMLWRAAYADGILHKREEGLIRQVSELLYIPHKDFVQVKLRVQEEH